uniref:Fibrinogen C-terminal domain-containing protein n=1 Tax=Amphimedon queenslandica TaxID=400682 RepID=A0A1X7V1K8_AMPQE
MEGEDNLSYESVKQDNVKEDNVYEFIQLSQASTNEEKKFEPKDIKKRNNKDLTWNKPMVHVVLLSLIVILQVGILCLLLAHMSTRDTICTTGATTEATADNNEYPNFTQWANDIVNKVNQSLPDFDEWAKDIVFRVNKSLGAATKINSNVTESLPDFNEWANSIVFKNNTNFTEINKQIIQTTRDSAQMLIKIVNTLSSIQGTSTSTAGAVDDTFLFMIHLLLAHNSSFGFSTSCKQIKKLLPTSPSGYYVLASANGSTYTAYCNMEELCGSGGGWTRLAYLDMTDSTVSCPSGFRLYHSGGVRACGRVISSVGSCASVQFPSNGISYSQICGRVTGYQYASPDAIQQPTYLYRNDINSYYVDGVSITRGSSRRHVWTLMAGFTDSYSSLSSCPCNIGSTVSVQSFIGSNYFCESGITGSVAYGILYTSDPLWDGQSCGSDESPCCNIPGIPWFHSDYGNTTTTDYIELRVCADQGNGNEDTPFGYYEIYVKFRLYQSGGVRACGRAISSVGSCTSVQFPSNGISYSQICGRVTGYQYVSPDAIQQPTYSYRNDINSYYVDGVSITCGSPRQHVWTLMAGYTESVSSSSSSCPSNNGSTVSVQSFIANNYFCASDYNGGAAYSTLYTGDPLWDGKGCGFLESPCCNVPGIPWFHRDYGSNTTTDYIELRMCANAQLALEDVPLSSYEIYVK